MGEKNQTMKPCPSCGGRGRWQEARTETFTVVDKDGKVKTERGTVQKDIVCSGQCKGAGYIYA